MLPSLTPEDTRTTEQIRNSHTIEQVRKTRDDKTSLAQRETIAAIRGYIYEGRATDSYWGFELQDVRAKKIVILSGEMEKYTPLPSVR
jgi:hypothetical protein